MPLWAVHIALGLLLGLAGVLQNKVKAWSEAILWVAGGGAGALLVAATGGWVWGWILGAAGVGAPAVTGATPDATTAGGVAAVIAVLIWSAASLLGSLVCPFLDDRESRAGWVVSLLLKLIQAPLTATAGLVALIVTLILAATGGRRVGFGRLDFRRGAFFLGIGRGTGALTLGPAVYTRSGHFDRRGRRGGGAGGARERRGVDDDLARHEAVHTRTVVALGELGFYVTYATLGALWSWAETGGLANWNALNRLGCGNPFEKKAYTFTDPGLPRCH